MWKWRYLWQGTGLCTVHLWVVTGQANSFRHSGCWVYSEGSRNCLSRFTRWWRQLPVLYRQFVAHCHGKLFWWSCVQQVLQSIEVDIKTNNIGHLCNKLYFLLRIIFFWSSCSCWRLWLHIYKSHNYKLWSEGWFTLNWSTENHVIMIVAFTLECLID